jgi:hypothetical protein
MDREKRRCNEKVEKRESETMRERWIERKGRKKRKEKSKTMREKRKKQEQDYAGKGKRESALI